jgi:hypothetical protein
MSQQDTTESDPFGDFNEFVERHRIRDDELGAAFAAWLSRTGWNGDFERVDR